MKIFKVFKRDWFLKCMELGDEYLYAEDNRDNPKYKVFCFLDTPQIRNHITELDNKLKHK
jgi:hypothetical protein